MATEQLKVKITADASQAKAEISKFKDSLKGTVSAGEATTKAIGKTTIALGAMLVAVKAVKSAVKSALNVAATGDAIKDNAQKVFMSATAYQEWGYVLKQNGIEINNLKTGMRQFAQHVAAGDDTLRKYGITATNVDDAFNQAIATIQNMTSETDKITAATELFGSRALELFPVLNMTNQETQNLMNSYRALGGTMSNELIAASDMCNDSITAMKAAWGGLRNLLATYLLPIITKIVQWITLLIAKVRIVLSVIFGVKESFGGTNKKNSVAGASASAAKNTGGMAKNLGKSAKKAKELRRTLMGIDELTKLAEKATESAAGGGGGGGGGIGDIGDIGGGGLESLVSDETLEKIEKFRKRVEEIKQGISTVAQGFKDIFNGDWSAGIEKLKEGLLLIFPRLAEFKQKWEDLKSKVSNFTATATLALSDKFSSLWNKVKSIWNGIKDKTATLKIAFTDKMKSTWNALAKKVQAARKKGGLAKKLLPNMPYLAKGGVLTSPIAAIMGEYPGARQNPEIATPQSLMYETIMKAQGDMVAAQATIGRQIIAAIENKDLTVKIGDETIAKSAQRGNTAYYNRTGKALITV